uniref:Uncharacterized protein n=1 Tax=Desertifilum tharense IPPAS B-1220 TaxID=1781255 RepID=A0ACD5GW03_9CYAN
MSGNGSRLYSELVRQVTSQHEVYHKHPLSGKMYRKRHLSERTEPLKHFAVGLFGVNNSAHTQQRRLVMPAFHKQRIESYRDDIVTITHAVLEQLPVGEVCDIAGVMRLLTMRVVQSDAVWLRYWRKQCRKTLAGKLRDDGKTVDGVIAFRYPWIALSSLSQFNFAT